MNRNKEGEIESLRVLRLGRYSRERKRHGDATSYGISSGKGIKADILYFFFAPSTNNLIYLKLN